MTENKRFYKGEYTNCWYDICEIEKDEEIICTVALKDADFIIEIFEENEKLEKEIEQLKSICQDHRDHANDFKADCVRLEKENEELKELLELISKAHSFTKEESVKEILRHEIKAIDTVTGDSARAWHDYGLLSNFFKKQYGEHWDNE